MIPVLTDEQMERELPAIFRDFLTRDPWRPIGLRYVHHQALRRNGYHEGCLGIQEAVKVVTFSTYKPKRAVNKELVHDLRNLWTYVEDHLDQFGVERFDLQEQRSDGLVETVHHFQRYEYRESLLEVVESRFGCTEFSETRLVKALYGKNRSGTFIRSALRQMEREALFVKRNGWYRVI